VHHVARSPLNAEAVQPVSYFVGAVFLQPGQVRQVLRPVHRMLGQQGRRGEDGERRGDQRARLQPRPFSVAVADGELGAAGRQINHLRRGVQHQLDLRVQAAERGEPRHKERLREARRHGDLEGATLVLLREGVECGADRVEAFRQPARERGAVGGQGEPAPLPGHQRPAQLRLQPPHRLRHGGVRHVHLPPRSGKAEGARRGLECAQRGQRGQGAGRAPGGGGDRVEGRRHL
jgi:hypothetical protein